MKSCSPELAEHLAQDSTTLAYLWKLKRQGGTVLTFTTHDEDILYPPGIDLESCRKGSGPAQCRRSSAGAHAFGRKWQPGPHGLRDLCQ